MRSKELVTHLLKELGITGSDATVYLAALELGPTTISRIAAKVQAQRPTVYAALDRLRDRGLVPEELQPYARRVTVESPEKLLGLANAKKRMLEDQTLKLQEALPDMLAVLYQRGQAPKVRFYEGREQFIHLFDQALEETKQKMCFFGAASLFVDLISLEYERDWIRRRVAKGILIHILVHKSEVTAQFRRDDPKELRVTRFLPESSSFKGSFLLYSTRVVFWNPTVPLAIRIDDAVTMDMVQVMFQLLWESGKR